MSRALEKFRKLQGRSTGELRERAAQMLNARMERYGLSALTRLPTDDEFFALLDRDGMMGAQASAESLLDHFRRRTSPAFFASFDDCELTKAELLRRFGPATIEAVTERARRICEGSFDLLGFHHLSFGAPPDFHLEPISGRRSPLKHWSLFDELDSNLTGDKKVIWELNRQQYFATLGRAYWYTDDEQFSRAFVDHLEAWMDQNPPKFGINWLSSLEISFRSISWLWAFHFFRHSPLLTPAVFLRAFKFLYLHGAHLENYLSTYSSPNTHLTGEALGLFYLGTLLPELKCAERWRSKGEGVLLAELERHVRPDGVYFEQTSYYHRYTTDFYTHLYLLMRANNHPVGPLLMEKLKALLDHLMHITRPDGTAPLFGDDDGGRLLMLDERAANDFRAALSTGASLFARPDYKYVAGGASEETLWLLGPEGLQAFDELEARPPEATSRAFTDGGYYIMRDGWANTSNYMLIDSGPHGTLNCGHAHADALAFEVAASGRTLLLDPGTYSYSCKEDRDYFRSTAAHNALTVDGQSSSVPAGPFSWQHIARCILRGWESRPRFDFFEGEHDGFARLAEPAIHRRSVLFLKNDYWIVRDVVQSKGPHQYSLNFHFAADVTPVIETADESGAVVVHGKDGEPGLELFSFGLTGAGARGEWQIEEGWTSLCYGQRSRSAVGVFSQDCDGSAEFISLIVPQEAHEAKTRARECEAENGRAFEVLHDDARDVLVLCHQGMARVGEIVSDFEWAWARWAGDEEILQEVLLRGGHVFRVGGREVLMARERVGHLVMALAGDELHVETDARGELQMASLGAKHVVFNGREFAVNDAERLEFVDGRPSVESLLAENNFWERRKSCVGLTE